MSLKTIHVLFITLSTLLAFGFGGWSFVHYSHHDVLGYLVAAIASYALGGSLIIYGIWFLRKNRDMSFM